MSDALPNERAVDRVPSDLKAPIYTTHSSRREVQIIAAPFGAVRGHVVRIADDTFDIFTGSETHRVWWRDLRAAGTVIVTSPADVPTSDGENDGQMLARIGTDGEAWAREWLRLNPLGLLAANEDDLDAMRAWFANAIEAGRSAGQVVVTDEMVDRVAVWFAGLHDATEPTFSDRAYARSALAAAFSTEVDHG